MVLKKWKIWPKMVVKMRSKVLVNVKMLEMLLLLSKFWLYFFFLVVFDFDFDFDFYFLLF